MNKKKIFLALIALVVLVGGYFAYNAWQKSQKQAKAKAIGANFSMLDASEEAAVASADKPGETTSEPASQAAAGSGTGAPASTVV